MHILIGKIFVVERSEAVVAEAVGAERSEVVRLWVLRGVRLWLLRGVRL